MYISTQRRIVYVLICAALLTPLLVWTGVVFSFVVPKMLAFEGSILLAGSILVYLWYKNPDAYTPKISLLALVIVGYVGVNLIAALREENFFRSVWSTFERMDGIFLWFTLLSFLLILETLCNKRRDWLLFLRVSFLTSIIVSLNALNFSLFFKPIFLAFLVSPNLFGNSLFLGIYVLAHIAIGFLCFSLDASVKKEDGIISTLLCPWGGLYACGILINIATLFMTFERGVILAFVLGIFISSIWYARWGKEKEKLVITLTTLFLGVFLLLPFVNLPRLILRFKLIAGGWGEDRRINFVVATRAILARPFLGWGSNNYVVAQNEFYNPRLFALTQESFDRPHNKYLEVAVDSGMAGLVFYLSIFVIAFYYLFCARKEEPCLTALLAGFLGAYCVYYLTFFDNPGSYLPLFLLLAFLDAQFIPSFGQARKINFFAFVLLEFFVAFLLWQGVWQFLQAGVALKYALKEQAHPQKNFWAIERAYQKSFSYGQFDLYTQRITLGKFLARQEEFTKEILDYEILQLKKEHVQNSNEVLPLLLLANLYEYKGQIEGDPSIIGSAQNLFREAIRLSPTRPESYEYYAAFLLNEGRTKEARLQLQTIKSLDKDVFESVKDQWYLGVSYVKEHNTKTAYQLFYQIVQKEAPQTFKEQKDFSSKIKSYDFHHYEYIKENVVRSARDTPQYHLFLQALLNYMNDKTAPLQGRG